MTVQETRIGVDVGGTNTDAILVDGREEYRYKTATTDNPAVSTARSAREVCELADISPERVDRLGHGTTVATNALLEGEGAETGMLTTKGFKDAIHIGRHRKLHTFSLQHVLPWQKQPVVRRQNRRSITERVYPPDEVVRPLDEEEVIAETEHLVANGVESIAICYLHSYVNSEHEDRTKALIEEQFPDLFVCASSEIIPRFREFERFMTTAINARLAPLMSNYLSELNERLWADGFDSEILVMQSNGGLASLQHVRKTPVTTMLSGPAAGVLSADFEGNQSGQDHLITFDMGGTSADISVVPGRILDRDVRDSKIGDYPTIVPMLDIETIGSGGGSIAWLDSAKGFNVGPKSAGANPGPACYDNGNDEPTITDAQVALGRINPATFLGGDKAIDPELSRQAIRENLCSVTTQERFESVESAALAMLEVANNKMYRSIREQTVQRGHDPRAYSLVAFGGAGPMHATSLAEQLDVDNVLIPPAPGVSSARGLLTGDVTYDDIRTISRLLDEIDGEELSREFGRLERRAVERLEADGIAESRRQLEQTVECLYDGQGYELPVEFDGTDGDWRARVRDRFERKHEAEYGHYFEDNPIEVLNVRVRAIGAIEDHQSSSIEEGGPDPSHAETERSRVVFGPSTDPTGRSVPRYDRGRLQAENRIEGPAVIDESTTTVVVRDGWEATVQSNRTLELTRESRGGA